MTSRGSRYLGHDEERIKLIDADEIVGDYEVKLLQNKFNKFSMLIVNNLYRFDSLVTNVLKMLKKEQESSPTRILLWSMSVMYLVLLHVINVSKLRSVLITTTSGFF
jgi:hypothetical protein